MRKYMISAVAELFTFVAVIVLLWNFTKMDAVEIIAVDLFISYNRETHRIEISLEE